MWLGEDFNDDSDCQRRERGSIWPVNEKVEVQERPVNNKSSRFI
jgi:hypothetical protein